MSMTEMLPPPVKTHTNKKVVLTKESKNPKLTTTCDGQTIEYIPNNLVYANINYPNKLSNIPEMSKLRRTISKSSRSKKKQQEEAEPEWDNTAEENFDGDGDNGSNNKSRGSGGGRSSRSGHSSSRDSSLSRGSRGKQPQKAVLEFSDDESERSEDYDNDALLNPGKGRRGHGGGGDGRSGGRSGGRRSKHEEKDEESSSEEDGEDDRGRNGRRAQPARGRRRAPRQEEQDEEEDSEEDEDDEDDDSHDGRGRGGLGGLYDPLSRRNAGGASYLPMAYGGVPGGGGPDGAGPAKRDRSVDRIRARSMSKERRGRRDRSRSVSTDRQGQKANERAAERRRQRRAALEQSMGLGNDDSSTSLSLYSVDSNASDVSHGSMSLINGMDTSFSALDTGLGGRSGRDKASTDYTAERQKRTTGSKGKSYDGRLDDVLSRRRNARPSSPSSAADGDTRGGRRPPGSTRSFG